MAYYKRTVQCMHTKDLICDQCTYWHADDLTLVHIERRYPTNYFDYDVAPYTSMKATKMGPRKYYLTPEQREEYNRAYAAYVKQ